MASIPKKVEAASGAHSNSSYRTVINDYMNILLDENSVDLL